MGSAYQSIIKDVNYPPDSFFKQMWVKNVPLKVTAFAWRVALNRIPSMQNLIRISVVDSSQGGCVGCNEEIESVTHLFFEYNFFAMVWMLCLKGLGYDSALLPECRSHFMQFMGIPDCSLTNRKEWITMWFSVIWSIWLARNQMRFESKTVSTDQIIEDVKFRSWSWLSSKVKRFSYPFSVWWLKPGDYLNMRSSECL